ncbi:hypothetical protein MMC08_002548 [Hypocenomyce scalaris]|nr:hypothetical protein [Hypocenomyce scalaris]
MSTPTSSVKASQERLIAAYKSHNVDQLLSFFSKRTSYSDYGVGHIDMDFKAVQAFVIEMFKKTADMNLDIHSISGTETFTAWENEMSFKFVEESELLLGGSGGGADH